MFLADAEQCSIPARVAERASRIGYRLKSCITWRKRTSQPRTRPNPSHTRSRVHPAPERRPDATAVSKERVAGPNARAWEEQIELLESQERITDVWSLPVAAGKNGHGAEFPLALPGRCIALSSQRGGRRARPIPGLWDDCARSRQAEAPLHRHRDQRAIRPTGSRPAGGGCHEGDDGQDEHHTRSRRSTEALGFAAAGDRNVAEKATAPSRETRVHRRRQPATTATVVAVAPSTI